MTKKITNSFDDIGDFDFFDFSDVDPVEVKKGAIANDLCALIAHEHLSRAKLARKLKWKPSRLTKVLSGEQNLTVKTITDIAVALEYDFRICFHKIHETIDVQPWEKKLRAIPKVVEQKKSSNNFLIWQVQTCDEVKEDIRADRAKDLYISVEVPVHSTNITKTINVQPEVKSIENRAHSIKDLIFSTSEKMVVQNV